MHRIHLTARVLLLLLAVTLGSAATASAAGDPIELRFRGTGTITEGPSKDPAASATQAVAPANVQPDVSLDRTPPGKHWSHQVKARARGRLLRLLRRSGTLDRSFQGLTHFDQFTAVAPDVLGFGDRTTPRGARAAGTPIEPPDQGLCAGNGYVLESVNSAARVFDEQGSPLTPTISLDRLYGNPPLFDPSTGRFGTLSVDVGCYYDAPAQRWFHIALTLEFDPVAGFPSGPTHIDLAVSRGPNPLGSWAFYELPLQNDGSEGTPDDNCNLNWCFGDFPHIGADEHGIYLTTNQFDLFGLTFHGANVYAISKSRLARALEDVTAYRFRTAGRFEGENAFGLWPAQSPPESFDNRAGGTQWFLNVQRAADDAIGVWALVNTHTLDRPQPDLELLDALAPVTPFTPGTFVPQKPGDFPLGQCINDTTIPTPLGDGCWRFLLASEPAHNATLQLINGGDPRMQQVSYAGGSIWAAHGVAVNVGGATQDGVALYELEPAVRGGEIVVDVEQSRQFGVAGANLLFPAVAVRDDGRGAMAFTLVGPNDHPSAAYAFVGRSGVGDVRVAAAGVGAQDGQLAYPQLGGTGGRWGDYSAAVVNGRHVWLATEYIAQSCTLAEFVADATCGGTRTTHANWATRVFRVTP